MIRVQSRRPSNMRTILLIFVYLRLHTVSSYRNDTQVVFSEGVMLAQTTVTRGDQPISPIDTNDLADEPETNSAVLNPLVKLENVSVPGVSTVQRMLEVDDGNEITYNMTLTTESELTANRDWPTMETEPINGSSNRSNLIRWMLRRASDIRRSRRQRRPSRIDGLLRLVNGDTDYEGNVEIWHDGKWGSVCDDEWDIREARVVCRQLGYPGVLSPTHNAQFGHGRATFWMDNLACTGSESDLKSCRFDGWGIHDCSPAETAGVVCASIPTAPPPSTTTAPRTTSRARKLSDVRDRIISMRLSGGRVPEEGRVEILLEKYGWRLVCGDGWSLLEAAVVCRSLGFGYAVTATQTDYFGGSRQDIILHGVKCEGQERSLSDCLHSAIGYGHCPGQRDNVAGVVCTSHMADLIPDHLEVMRSAHLEDRQLFFLSCALEENCLGNSAYQLQKENSYGWHLETRRLLRFTARIANIGNAAFRPFLPKHMWEWHACHMHYHSMEVFANYDILDSKGARVAEGHKASFCLEDAECKPGVEPVYACANFGDQGISVGCTDTYKHNIDCQWIDMTDVKPGNYFFKVSINPEMKVGEQRFDNNAALCNLLYTESYAYVWNCTLTKI